MPGKPWGQALVLFVTLLGVLCLGVILLFNTGQVVNKKVRLTNAVDAAAYSVAVQQARTLNFAAYMNRGRVANEVAIAQMVSMFSWINHLHAHTGQFRVIFEQLQAIPIIGPVFSALQAAYRAVEYALRSFRTPALKPAMEGVIVLDDTLNRIYAEAASAMIEQGAAVEAAAISTGVLSRNDPDATMSAEASGLLLTQLQSAKDAFIELHELPRNGTSAGMDRYRNVVMESRDWFSRDRHTRAQIGEGMELGVPVVPGGFARVEVSVRNDVVTQGGTDMVEYDRWSALDTLSFDYRVQASGVIGRCVPIIGCVEVRETFLDESLDIPMGYGGAMAVSKVEGQRYRPGIGRNAGWGSLYEPRFYQPYNGVGGITGQLAEWDPAVQNPLWRDGQSNDQYLKTYTGLKNYHDIRAGRAMTPEDGPVFTVYAFSDAARVRTSDVAGTGGTPGGALDLPSTAHDGRYTAIASAQVYFQRPVGLDRFRRQLLGEQRRKPLGRAEMGSLFSPYWQARLVETPAPAYAALGISTP